MIPYDLPESAALAKLSSMSFILKGRPASPGICAGQALLAASPDGTGAEKRILVLKTSSMDWIEAISQCSGVITEVGGITSHAATICRELGKPCVTAVVDATSVIQNGMTVAVDGSAGIVTVLE